MEVHRADFPHQLLQEGGAATAHLASPLCLLGSDQRHQKLRPSAKAARPVLQKLQGAEEEAAALDLLLLLQPEAAAPRIRLLQPHQAGAEEMVAAGLFWLLLLPEAVAPEMLLPPHQAGGEETVAVALCRLLMLLPPTQPEQEAAALLLLPSQQAAVEEMAASALTLAAQTGLPRLEVSARSARIEALFGAMLAIEEMSARFSQIVSGVSTGILRSSLP